MNRFRLTKALRDADEVADKFFRRHNADRFSSFRVLLHNIESQNELHSMIYFII